MPNKFKLSFFDYLQLADREKIHTQMINWLFSLKEEILSNETKQLLLEKICKTPIEKFDTIKSSTEENNIDLIIETNSSLFIFEVKLKSSEHSEQTDRYTKNIYDNKDYKNLEKYFMYLTLNNEKAKSEDFKSVTFKDLLQYLKEISNDIKEQKTKLFLDEYMNSLSNLTTIEQDFIKNYRDDKYKFMFEKLKIESDLSKYVIKNKLKNFLLKSLFHSINSEIKYDELKSKCKDTKNLNRIFESSVGSSSRTGNSAIQVILYEFKYDSTYYVLGFRWQGNFKITISEKNYIKSKKEDLPEDSKIIKVFKEVFSLNKKLNKPTKKAAYSTSLTKEDRNLRELGKEKIISEMCENILEINNKISIFQEKLFS